MKKSELKHIIKEEIKKVLAEGIISVDVNIIKKIIQKCIDAHKNDISTINSKLLKIDLINTFDEEIEKYKEEFPISFAFKIHLADQEKNDLKRHITWDTVGIIGAGTQTSKIITVELTKDFNKDFDNPAIVKLFVNIFSDIIVHEYIHLQQLDRMNTKHNDNYNELVRINKQQNTYNGLGKEYLSKAHEMMAYAKNAVDELLDAGLTPDVILQNLKKTRKWDDLLCDKSEIFFRYYSTFNNFGTTYGKPKEKITGEDKEIFNKFLKFVYAYTVEAKEKLKGEL